MKIDDIIYEGTCICTAISSSNDNDKNDGQNHQQEDNSDEDGDNRQQPHWIVRGQLSCGGRQLFLRRLQQQGNNTCLDLSDIDYLVRNYLTSHIRILISSRNNK